MFRKTISILLTFGLLFQQLGFAQVAGELNIAGHLANMHSSISIDKFRPLHLRYFSYDLKSDNFKFLFDKGDSDRDGSLMEGSRREPSLSLTSQLTQSPAKESVPPIKGTVSEELLSEQTKKLLNYFLIGITLPDSKFWVNLRPDSQDQLIEPELEQTDLGRVLLEADLQLKKDTAKYTSPETPEGREYWNKLYKKAEELFGHQTITIPTLTRPWIVPGEIIIRETADSSFIYKSTLKVMLEEDYLTSSTSKTSLTGKTDYSFQDPRLKALNEYSSQLIRELIIPKLTKEVNISKKYAPLRQVFYSLILSRWFKARFRGAIQGLSPQTGTGHFPSELTQSPAKESVPSIKGAVPFYVSLIDSQNLNGLTSKDSWSKTTYFKEYQKSFNNGEYNLKEPVYTPTGQVIRSYFSGGIIGPTIDQIRGVGVPEGQNVPIDTISSPILMRAVSDSSITPTPNNVSLPIIKEDSKQSAASPVVEVQGLAHQLSDKIFSIVRKPIWHLGYRPIPELENSLLRTLADIEVGRYIDEVRDYLFIIDAPLRLYATGNDGIKKGLYLRLRYNKKSGTVAATNVIAKLADSDEFEIVATVAVSVRPAASSPVENPKENKKKEWESRVLDALNKLKQGLLDQNKSGAIERISKLTEDVINLTYQTPKEYRSSILVIFLPTEKMGMLQIPRIKEFLGEPSETSSEGNTYRLPILTPRRVDWSKSGFTDQEILHRGSPVRAYEAEHPDIKTLDYRLVLLSGGNVVYFEIMPHGSPSVSLGRFEISASNLVRIELQRGLPDYLDEKEREYVNSWYEREMETSASSPNSSEFGEASPQKAAGSPVTFQLKLDIDQYEGLGRDPQGIFWGQVPIDISDSKTTETLTSLIQKAKLTPDRGQLALGTESAKLLIVARERINLILAIVLDRGRIIQLVPSNFNYTSYFDLLLANGKGVVGIAFNPDEHIVELPAKAVRIVNSKGVFDIIIEFEENKEEEPAASSPAVKTEGGETRDDGRTTSSPAVLELTQILSGTPGAYFSNAFTGKVFLNLLGGGSSRPGLDHQRSSLFVEDEKVVLQAGKKSETWQVGVTHQPNTLRPYDIIVSKINDKGVFNLQITYEEVLPIRLQVRATDLKISWQLPANAGTASSPVVKVQGHKDTLLSGMKFKVKKIRWATGFAVSEELKEGSLGEAILRLLTSREEVNAHLQKKSVIYTTRDSSLKTELIFMSYAPLGLRTKASILRDGKEVFYNLYATTGAIEPPSILVKVIAADTPPVHFIDTYDPVADVEISISLNVSKEPTTISPVDKVQDKAERAARNIVAELKNRVVSLKMTAPWQYVARVHADQLPWRGVIDYLSQDKMQAVGLDFTNVEHRQLVAAAIKRIITEETPREGGSSAASSPVMPVKGQSPSMPEIGRTGDSPYRRRWY